MIKITIPEFDFTVTVETLSTIPYGTPGVYMLYDNNNSLMYVGKASDLRGRILTHFRGITNTSHYVWSVHKCNAFIEEKATYRSIYELYLIDLFHPPLNNSSNAKMFKGKNVLMDKADPNNLHPAFCKYILKDGTQCSKTPRDNGFCYLHGGK